MPWGEGRRSFGGDSERVGMVGEGAWRVGMVREGKWRVEAWSLV